MPLCISLSYALRSALALRMPLCISLSTSPARAAVRFTVEFPCACLDASHCALSLRVPLRISLCTCPTHASMHCTVDFLCACLYACNCLLSELAAGAAGVFFANYFCTQKLRLCSRSCGGARRVLLSHSKVTTLQPELRGRTSRTTFELKSCEFAGGSLQTVARRPRKCPVRIFARAIGHAHGRNRKKARSFCTSTAPTPHAEGRARTAGVAKNHQFLRRTRASRFAKK